MVFMPFDFPDRRKGRRQQRVALPMMALRVSPEGLAPSGRR